MSTEKKYIKTIKRNHEVWGEYGSTIWELDGLYYVHGLGEYGQPFQVLPDRFEHLDDATAAAGKHLDGVWLDRPSTPPAPPVQHVNERGEILLDGNIVVSIATDPDRTISTPGGREEEWAIISVSTKGPGTSHPASCFWRDEARAVGQALLRLADYYPEVEVES